VFKEEFADALVEDLQNSGVPTGEGACVLKPRLHFALLPQMIAHEFPISQQKSNAKAADMFELYAPLFASLAGKEQVLIPDCNEVNGENDVNLLLTGYQQAP